MSTLFNLSNVFSEDTSMLSDIVSQYIPRTFLSEAVSVLRVQDKVNIQSLDTLYSALHEAESKAEENSKFADYCRAVYNENETDDFRVCYISRELC